MIEVLYGATAMGSLVVALVFLRFWRGSRDRLFLYFAASFGIEGLNRFYYGASGAQSEYEPLYYLIRFVCYGLILVAIFEKNFARERSG